MNLLNKELCCQWISFHLSHLILVMECNVFQGPFAFYKGFIPNFGRLGSWNVIMFLTLEQVQVEYFVIAFHFSFPSYHLSHGILVYFYSILVCCGRG